MINKKSIIADRKLLVPWRSTRVARYLEDESRKTLPTAGFLFIKPMVLQDNCFHKGMVIIIVIPPKEFLSKDLQLYIFLSAHPL